MNKILVFCMFFISLTSCSKFSAHIGGNPFNPASTLEQLKNNADNYSDGVKTGAEYRRELNSLITKNNSKEQISNLISYIENQVISCSELDMFQGEKESQCVLNVYKKNINKIKSEEKEAELKIKEYEEKEKRIAEYTKKIMINKLNPTKNNMDYYCELSAISVANIAMTPFATGVRIASKYDEMRYLLMDDKIVWEIKKITGDNYNYQLMYTVYLRECESSPRKMIINYDKIFKK